MRDSREEESRRVFRDDSRRAVKKISKVKSGSWTSRAKGCWEAECAQSVEIHPLLASYSEFTESLGIENHFYFPQKPCQRAAKAGWEPGHT